MGKDFYIQPDAADPVLDPDAVLAIVRLHAAGAKAVRAVDDPARGRVRAEAGRIAMQPSPAGQRPLGPALQRRPRAGQAVGLARVEGQAKSGIAGEVQRGPVRRRRKTPLGTRQVEIANLRFDLIPPEVRAKG